MFSVICAWINSWDNNRDAGELRRQRAHHDVIVMKLTTNCKFISHCYQGIIPQTFYELLWVDNWNLVKISFALIMILSSLCALIELRVFLLTYELWTHKPFCEMCPRASNEVLIFSCDQAALRTAISVCLSVRLSVTPFWQCSCHPIIKFSGVITNDGSDVLAKGQGQRSKVKVTEVKNRRIWPRLGVSGL